MISVSIIVTIYVDPVDLPRNSEMGTSDVHPMIEKYPLDQVAEAYEQMHSGKVRFRVVLTLD